MELITIVHPNRDDYISIIFEFKDKVNKHILVYDKSDNEYAKELKKAINKLNKVYNLKSKIEILQIDEDSKSDLLNALKNIKVTQDSYLNGAGADIALFVFLSSFILQNNGKVLAYDIADNSYNIITKNGFVSKNIENLMSIDDYITLNNDTIISEANIAPMLKHKDSLELLFKNVTKLYELYRLIMKQDILKIEFDYKDLAKALIELEIIDSGYNLKVAGNFLGYLLEEYILLNVIDFDFDDIKCSAIISFDQMQVKNNNIEIKNEFDILVIKDNKMGFIECKMGVSSNAIETVYKSDSIMEYFGEYAKSIIVNLQNSKDKRFQSHLQYKDGIKFRAKTKNISIYNDYNFNKKEFEKLLINTFKVKKENKFAKQLKERTLQNLNNKFNTLGDYLWVILKSLLL